MLKIKLFNESSPLLDSGMERGDYLIAVNGYPIRTSPHLSTLMRSFSSNDDLLTLTITYANQIGLYDVEISKGRLGITVQQDSDMLELPPELRVLIEQTYFNDDDESEYNHEDYTYDPMPMIENIDELISKGPQIDNDQSKLVEYIHYIHGDLDRNEKGADLGLAIYAASCLQGMCADVINFTAINNISTEANNRMYAHVLYLKNIHSLNFMQGVSDDNVNGILVDMACEIVSKNELDFSILGIEGVKYIADNILD